MAPMADATALWRIEIRTSEDAVPAVEAALQPISLSVSTFVDRAPGRWRVEAIAGAEPDPQTLSAMLADACGGLGLAPPKATVERLAPRDWAGEALARFPPLRIGRYYVFGSHVRKPPPAAAVAICLDAGAAFGSGEHASTRGCLLALDRLAKERRVARALDLGCGSGILAIAIAKTWRAKVIATDIDPDAVRVAGANAATNHVAGPVRVACGDGYRPSAVAAGAPYDLIVANVLARPLARLAGDLARHLTPDGVAVLSGLIERDVAWVAAAHRAFGFRLVRSVVLDGWATLVLGR